LVLK